MSLSLSIPCEFARPNRNFSCIFLSALHEENFMSLVKQFIKIFSNFFLNSSLFELINISLIKFFTQHTANYHCQYLFLVD